MIKRYVKKPVEIEAIQWTDSLGLDIEKFVGVPLGHPWDKTAKRYDDNKLIIPTLEGPLNASRGDYIIKGIKGEFYPCKPDIFEESYDLCKN